MMESTEVKLGNVVYDHPNTTYALNTTAGRSDMPIQHSSILPTVPASIPQLSSGTIGKLLPTQKPFAFTTVTYAKQPNGASSILTESYAAKYASAQDRGGIGLNYPGHRTRFVRKQRGLCGGFNECLGAPYDSNGGMCGVFNLGCCDRGQRVPVDVDFSPEGEF